MNRFANHVYAIARHAFGLRSHDAEEIFQEVFARTYEHLGELSDPQAIGTWIRQIARRLCIDRLRAGSHVPLPEDETELGPDVDETLQQVDEAMAVQQALASLPEPCREVLDRFFCREETYQTISEVLGLPYGTIASRISRGLDKLRHDLEVEEFSRQRLVSGREFPRNRTPT